jgi:TPR repeat protein
MTNTATNSFKFLFVALLIGLPVMSPLHTAFAGGHGRYYRPRPKTPSKPANQSTNATPAQVSATNAHPLTNYFPPVPALPVTVATPLTPEQEAARKAETAAKVLAWHQEQAANDSAYAQYQMGLHYLNGEGVEKNVATAMQWFLKSARQGNDDAYEKLKNVDYTEAPDGTGENPTVRKDFMKQSGHPDRRPRYVIEYIVLPANGGRYAADNMSWVKIEEARKAEKWDELKPAADKSERADEQALS